MRVPAPRPYHEQDEGDLQQAQGPPVRAGGEEWGGGAGRAAPWYENQGTAEAEEYDCSCGCGEGWGEVRVPVGMGARPSNTTWAPPPPRTVLGTRQTLVRNNKAVHL